MTHAKHTRPPRGVTSPAALTDRRGGIVPSALPLLDEREVLLMRLLGRLDLMTLTQIQQGAYAYGLADQGKELLNTLEVEHDPLTFDRLVSRDPRGRKPDLRTLAHDLRHPGRGRELLLS